MVPRQPRKPRRKRILAGLLSLILILLILVLTAPPTRTLLLLSAADRGDAAKVRLLLRWGTDPDASGLYIPADQTPLMLAARRGSWPTVQVLLAHGADVNWGGNDWSVSPLMCAVEGGNEDIVRALIARGADVNASDGSAETPLSLAREHHRAALVALLKRAGATDPPPH